MEYMFWFLIFAVLAVLATVPVHFHLASLRRASGGTSPAPPGKTRPCPRCQHPTPADAAFCEKCGVPMMLWKVKAAREVSSGDSSRLIPIVDQDVCIGCSACVNACDKGVLEIVAGKSAVIDPNSCASVGTCVEVCPTGACQLGGGGSARRLEVPQIDENFETNQKGVFVIGELGGLGLIKNAVTEGRLIIERIKESHESREGVLDLVIVGAGPAGLSAGLSAKEADLKTVILEQGSLANTIRRFPNRKLVMAEPIQIPMYGSLWVSDAPKETLLSVWQTIIQSAGIEINENESVLGMRRNGNNTFIVNTSKQEYECLKVILAIGKRGTPNELSVPGADLPKVLYHLADTAKYANSRILVVGGGDSAVEAAIGLSKQEGNQVTLSYRRKEFTRLREKNLKSLEERVHDGAMRLLLESQVREVGERDVLLEATEGNLLRLENDYVFAFLGGSSPKSFLENIGIPMVTKEVAMEGPEHG